MSVESLEAQGKVAVTFLNGLLDAFGFEATVAVRSVNDSAVEVAVDGEDLGLLVGPRGATLQAIQDLTRTAVLRETGMRDGWVIVDVAEYRVKRRAALEKFAMQVADQVTARRRSGSARPDAAGGPQGRPRCAHAHRRHRNPLRG